MSVDLKQKRIERRTLKQQLFAIRRHVEGEDVELTEELAALKAQYEALPGFTEWSDFPELWDIGDPYGVKAPYIHDEDPAFSDVERNNYLRLQGKPYDEIVPLNRQPGLNVGEGKEHFQAPEEEVVEEEVEAAVDDLAGAEDDSLQA